MIHEFVYLYLYWLVKNDFKRVHFKVIINLCVEHLEKHQVYFFTVTYILVQLDSLMILHSLLCRFESINFITMKMSSN